MNAPQTFPTATMIARANIRRAIDKLEAMSAALGTRDDDFAKLVALDALGHVFDHDMVADYMADLRDDLGMDEEGYPLTEEGDLDIRADRVWIPLPSNALQVAS
jgi:hypothetical protein